MGGAMQKKLVYIFMPIIVFLSFINFVYAECDYDTEAKINNAAGTVRAEYQTYEYNNNYYDETYDEEVSESYWYGLIHI